MREDKQITPYPLRIESELRKILEASAKANGRSLHAEIVARLAASTDYKFSEELELEEKIRRIAREVVQEELAKRG